MKRFSLRFIIVALTLAVTVEAFESRRSFSTMEQTLFGYSSAEDCLFGASSVLTSNVRSTDGDERENGIDVKSERPTKEIANDDAPRPAFIRKPPENV
jgi:hypothetical protein